MKIPYPGTTKELTECSDCGREFLCDPFYNPVCDDCLIYYDDNGEKGPIIFLTTKEINHEAPNQD